VDVRVLLWDPWSLSRLLRIVNSPPHQKHLLRVEGVQVRLDKSSHSLFHVAQALHQKFSVVDGTTAFIGGVDLTVSADGDFNRWDTPAHRFESADRATDLGPSPHPWHDVHLRVTGPPAADVEYTFLQRWEEAARPWWKRVSPPLKHLIDFALSSQRVSGQEAAREEEAGELPPGAGPPVSGASARVQVIRTIPALTYRFAPAGIYGIAQAYTLAIQRAQRFIYLESQYFWLERWLSLDLGLLGWPSHQLRALLEELAAAAERGVSVALVLPDHPNSGRSVTDSTITWFRTHAPSAAAQGRLHFFTLATAEVRPRDRVMRYRPIYVHAKVGVVDDRWATVGSANLNSRSMSHDAELNLAVLDEAFARGLRLSLWAEHLGLLDQVQTGWPAPATLPLPKPMVRPKAKGVRVLLASVDLRPREGDGAAPEGGPDTWAALEDPLVGFALLERRARENLEHLLRGEPLKGHLLPYLLGEEAKQCGLSVDRARGVLDPLRGLREGVAVRHLKRYT
jgi:phosphatidylserine/phosphatidylglycerophosphate/cardiolipin synthase-like enzyme